MFSSGDTMAAVIANEFGEATGTHRAALIGLGVVLFVITIVVNVAGRGPHRASTGGSQGGDGGDVTRRRRRNDRPRGSSSRGIVAAAGACRNALATIWMIGSVLVALVPLVFIVGYVVRKGLKVINWQFLTEDLPIIIAIARRRHRTRRSSARW